MNDLRKLKKRLEEFILADERTRSGFVTVKPEEVPILLKLLKEDEHKLTQKEG